MVSHRFSVMSHAASGTSGLRVSANSSFAGATVLASSRHGFYWNPTAAHAKDTNNAAWFQDFGCASANRRNHQVRLVKGFSLPLRHWISATSAGKWIDQYRFVLAQVLPFRDALGLVKKNMHSKTAWFLPFSLFKWHFFLARFISHKPESHCCSIVFLSPVFLAISLVFPDQKCFPNQINCVKNCLEIPNMLVCEWGSNCTIWIMRISTTKLSSMRTE